MTSISKNGSWPTSGRTSRMSEDGFTTPASTSVQAVDVVSNGGAVTAVAKARGASANLARQLRAGGFAGDILTTPEELAPYSRDYGRLATGTPALVAKPKTTADVQRVIHLAFERGIGVRARSGGHALEGQSLVNGGIVIATDDLRLPSGAKFELDLSGPQPLVRTVPGVRVGELWKFLAAQGYRPRVVTMDDYPGVGGAASAAGTGRGSHAYGTMVEQCMRLVGVTGVGKRIDVRSERTDYSQFSGADGAIAHLMLGSFGQAGVITDLSFPIIKVKGEIRRFGTVLPSLDALRDYLGNVIAAGNEDLCAVYGAIAKDPKSGKLTYLARVNRDVTDGSGDPVPAVGDPGADPNVLPGWLSIIYPSTDGAIQALVKHPELLTSMTNPGLTLLIPQKKMRNDPLSLNTWPKAKPGDLMMGLGVFNYGPRDVASAWVDTFRAMRSALVRDGAQQYFSEGWPKSASEWRAVLGPDRYLQIITALDKADPYGVFERLPGLERLRSAVKRN